MLEMAIYTSETLGFSSTELIHFKIFKFVRTRRPSQLLVFGLWKTG